MGGCFDADFTTTIFENEADDLLESQILSSSNCEYILTRSEPDMLSFYSVSKEYIIKNWNIESGDIWSLYPSDTAQTITLTDAGCVTWTNEYGEYESILHQICDEITTTTTTTSTSASVPMSILMANNDDAHFIVSEQEMDESVFNTTTITDMDGDNVLAKELHKLSVFHDDVMVGIFAPVAIIAIGVLLAVMCYFCVRLWQKYPVVNAEEEEFEDDGCAGRQFKLNRFHSVPSVPTIYTPKSVKSASVENVKVDVDEQPSMQVVLEATPAQQFQDSKRGAELVSQDNFVIAGDVMSSSTEYSESASDAEDDFSPKLWLLKSLPKLKSVKESEEMAMEGGMQLL